MIKLQIADCRLQIIIAVSSGALIAKVQGPAKYGGHRFLIQYHILIGRELAPPAAC